MESFVKCPFCAGHEAVGPEAAAEIARMITTRIQFMPEGPLQCELENICNAILNTQERECPHGCDSKDNCVICTPAPICPTPDKRKYSNREHALPFAVKWGQNPYACECGYWHLSKQKAAEHAAKINSPPAGPDEFDSEIDPLLT